MAKPDMAFPNIDTTLPSVMIVKSRVQRGLFDSLLAIPIIISLDESDKMKNRNAELLSIIII